MHDHIQNIIQGRNFGLKIGGTNSEGERGPLDPEARGEENEEEVSLPHPTLGSGLIGMYVYKASVFRMLSHSLTSVIAEVTNISTATVLLNALPLLSTLLLGQRL